MEVKGDKHNSVLGEEQSHESFGTVQISRISIGGEGMNLFDSSIRHSHVIALRVTKAKKMRQHGYRHIHGGNEIVEVYMSQTQFADMITSLNMGSGTPVTIKHIQGKRMEPCPVENQTQLHAQEFKERMQIFAETMRRMQQEAIEIASKKMNKKDAEEWRKKIEYLTTEISSNIPFFNKCFAEQMGKTVTEAKGEIEAFVTHNIVERGLESLFGQKGDDVIKLD
jgi:hypothetical protein